MADLADPGYLLAARYRLHHRIGQGGMASVFAATDRVLERAVAVKVFRVGGDTAQDRARMQTEVRLLASLSHPNLVTVFDASTDDSSTDARPFIVMELIGGPSLRERLTDGPMTCQQAAELGAQMAAGLDHVHARGIVHRDVKPANILLATADSGNGDTAAITAKLADFGIARLLDATRVTIAGTTIGTANYLSPEQVEGADIGPASDIYSLGLVLLESLTGQVAYPGSGIEAALARLHRAPTIPTEHGPDWAQLLEAMTTQTPQARPTAAEVRAALQPLTSDRPGHQRPAPTKSLPLGPATSRFAAATGPAEDTSQVVDRSRLRPVARVLASRLWWLAAVAVLAVATTVLMLSLVATDHGTARTPPPAYPSVPGQLGRDLHQLQQAVG
ncbi:serine/threonine-protein kinase [Pedococcus sp. NPDC057267]|uniref:serine/threonine-protein kinase n=1 Tax=Pedococcus sp. NPDC057267 TaxID=3346077 RepID=UPI00364345A2